MVRRYRIAKNSTFYRTKTYLLTGKVTQMFLNAERFAEIRTEMPVARSECPHSRVDKALTHVFQPVKFYGCIA